MAHANDTIYGAGLTLPVDGRQSPAALALRRGVIRLFQTLGTACVCELPLDNGRRADVAGLAPDGTIAIVEIKSSVDDFRSDTKWPEYRGYCDRLYFAVAAEFPMAMLPEECGLIVADRFGGEVLRAAPMSRLAAGRRKAMLLRFGRCAAFRLASAMDPEFALSRPGTETLL